MCNITESSWFKWKLQLKWIFFAGCLNLSEYLSFTAFSNLISCWLLPFFNPFFSKSCRAHISGNFLCHCSGGTPNYCSTCTPLIPCFLAQPVATATHQWYIFQHLSYFSQKALCIYILFIFKLSAQSFVTEELAFLYFCFWHQFSLLSTN